METIPRAGGDGLNFSFLEARCGRSAAQTKGVAPTIARDFVGHVILVLTQGLAQAGTEAEPPRAGGPPRARVRLRTRRNWHAPLFRAKVGQGLRTEVRRSPYPHEDALLGGKRRTNRAAARRRKVILAQCESDGR